MEFWDLVAATLWTSFAASLIGGVIGVILVKHGQRTLGLGLLLCATLVLLLFSFLGGFSIGRFTAAVPLLLTGLMVGLGRGALVILAWVVASIAIYFACSWLLTPLEFRGWLFALVFGAWAIPLYALLALLGFSVALTKPPNSQHS